MENQREKEKKVKSNVTFSLSESTIKFIEKQKEEAGLSKSAVVEKSLKDSSKYYELREKVRLFKLAMNDIERSSMSLEWALENLLNVD